MPMIRGHAAPSCAPKRGRKTLPIKLKHSVESLSMARRNLFPDMLKYEKLHVFKEMIYGDDAIHPPAPANSQKF